MITRKQAWSICNDFGADLADYEQDFEQATYMDGKQETDGSLVDGAEFFRDVIASAVSVERRVSWADAHYSNFNG